MKGNLTLSIEESKNEVTNNGVFFFPVWQTNSLVKRQNITAKVPNAMALSIMYGDGYDKISTLNQPPPDIQEVEGLVLSNLNKSKDNNDKNRQDVSIALTKKEYSKLGTTSSNADESVLERNKSTHDIRSWLKTNSNLIQTVYKDKIDFTRRQIFAIESEDENPEIPLDLSVPLPVPEQLEAEYPDKFRKLIQGKKYMGSRYAGGLEKVLNSKYTDSDRMKQNYIDYISQAIAIDTGDGEISEVDLPLIIPLDIELEIDGIGGILPSNSFHSTYLTGDYQKFTVFQIFDVGHKVDSTGWSVTIAGKMRTSFSKVSGESKGQIEISKLVEEIRKGQRVLISDEVFARGGERFASQLTRKTRNLRTVERDLED